MKGKQILIYQSRLCIVYIPERKLLRRMYCTPECGYAIGLIKNNILTYLSVQNHHFIAYHSKRDILTSDQVRPYSDNSPWGMTPIFSHDLKLLYRNRLLSVIVPPEPDTCMGHQG